MTEEQTIDTLIESIDDIDARAQLVELAKTSCDAVRLRIEIAFLEQAFYEELCELDAKKYEPLFLEEYPGAALVYAAKEDNKYLSASVIAALGKKKNEPYSDTEAYEFLDTYEVLLQMGWKKGEETAEDLIQMYHHTYGIDTFPLFGELYKIMLQHDDQTTMALLVDVMKGIDLGEALDLAQRCGDYDFIEEMEEADDVPLEEYAALFKAAQTLISQVERATGVKLPRRIQVGGPKGSYATIQYKLFGTKKGEYATQTNT